MSYTVKYATYQDLPQAISVEKETLGNYTYLEDAWHYFSTQKGELICVYDNTKMVGIGRFTVLPDGSGWLETLRVIPAYQRKGVGKEIYKKYLLYPVSKKRLEFASNFPIKGNLSNVIMS